MINFTSINASTNTVSDSTTETETSQAIPCDKFNEPAKYVKPSVFHEGSQNA